MLGLKTGGFVETIVDAQMDGLSSDIAERAMTNSNSSVETMTVLVLALCKVIFISRQCGGSKFTDAQIGENIKSVFMAMMPAVKDLRVCQNESESVQ